MKKLSCLYEKDPLTEIRIPADPTLLLTLDKAAGLMEISRDELVLKILKLWEKNQTMPLHGTDRLCQLDLTTGDQIRQS